MNKLEELIEKLCPNGVKYRKLSELCNYLKKGTLKTADLKEDGKYPVINSGRELYGFYDRYNNKDAITFAARGEYAGYISYFHDEFWAGGLCYPYSSKNEEVITNKFLYYYLKSRENIIMDVLVARGSIPALNKTDLDKFLVAVPPLKVQREIVRIMDDFTTISTNLSIELLAELKARKKQYEYYRNNLLTFNENVPRKSISELCYLSAGGDIDKKKVYKEINNEHNIPVISNGVGKNAIYGYTNQYKVEAPALTLSGRGTIGYCELRKENFYPIVRLICIKPKKKSVNISFLKYYIETIKFKVPTTGIPQLTVPMISNYKIPVPPVEEQEKIVNILNRFDRLCNDISEGLPVEIEARRKQYEYYRDKLLAFKEEKNDG